MSTEQQPATGPQPPQDQPGWGAPPPPPEQRPKWSVRRTIVAVAIAVGIAAAGGVAIYAASGTVDNTGGPGGRGDGGMVVRGPMSDVAHGEFQNGEVTSISDTSATVESDDGFSRTYVIDDETQLGDDIETGDDVMVIATTEDETATASVIMEQGAMPQGPNGGGQPRGNGPDDDQDGN